MKLPKQD